MAAYVALFGLVLLRWRSFWDRAVTPADWVLGVEVAFLASLPAGIAVHELGHAMAAMVSGASVTIFHVGLLHGYITVAGHSSVTQRWFIFLGAYPVVAQSGWPQPRWDRRFRQSARPSGSS